MKEELFDEFMQSLEEAAAIQRGEAAPSRTFRYVGHVLVEIQENGKRVWHISDAARQLSRLRKPDREQIRTIRETLKQSQQGFAELLGISVGTLRGWEQGRRKPTGPAAMLIKVAARHPEAVLDAIAEG
ncbi:MAG TPA: helix-turn-helix domain-containing protein [Rhodothermales bacterium]|nr:helix-turn-helix domain-containing protein [Rhodothermales bacterium]